jgi:hypothetical protein
MVCSGLAQVGALTALECIGLVQPGVEAALLWHGMARYGSAMPANASSVRARGVLVPTVSRAWFVRMHTATGWLLEIHPIAEGLHIAVSQIH